jgi:hypothetical protein
MSGLARDKIGAPLSQLNFLFCLEHQLNSFVELIDSVFKIIDFFRKLTFFFADEKVFFS